MLAPAKVTLSLRITGVRDDGLHLIDAVMVTVDLADELTFDESGDGLEIVDEAGGGGLAVAAGDDNLVVRALRHVGRRAHVRLRKRIPAGAGLGGGSADAAAVLRWAGAGPEGADALGADVPFCVVGGRARVTGVGEVLEPLPFEAQELTLLVPPFGCSTPAVYRAWDDLGGPRNSGGPNDLEVAALAVEPRLAAWRDRLGDATGQTPVLAGSGSTWFVPGAHDVHGGVVARTVPAGWGGDG